MEDKKTVTNYKYFIIAEILAVASFIPNAVNVLNSIEGHGPMSASWETKFGLLYWLKTVLSIVGWIFLRYARTKPIANKAILLKFIVFLTILYSIPVANTIIELMTGVLYKAIAQFPTPPISFVYSDRIPIIIIWSIPTLAILCDLIRRLYLYTITKR